MRRIALSLVAVSALATGSVLTGIPGSALGAPAHIPAALSAAPMATLDPIGSVRGQVTSRSGAPLAGARVLVRIDGTAPGRAYTATSGGDGGYVIDGVPATEITSWCVDASHVSGGYATRCAMWDRRAFDAASTAHLDVALDIGSPVSGEVTDQQGRPVPGADVNIRLLDRSGERAIIASTTSGADGRYRLRVAVGSLVQVCPSAPAVSRSGARYGLAEACSTTVRPGSSNIDVALPPAGAVQGRILTQGGTPLAGVVVSPPRSPNHPRRYALTAADGTYRLTGLDPGPTQICFDPRRAQPWTAAGYVLDCWGSGDDWTSAIVEPDRVVGGVSQRLVAAGAVRGRVTSPTGLPVAGARVTVTSAYEAETRSGADGSFMIRGVPAGRTTLCVTPSFGTADAPTGLLPECWKNAAYGNETPFTVARGSVVTGISPRLEAGGAITGLVTSASGQPLPGIEVIASTAGGDSGAATTDASGRYQVGSLPPGTYKVLFRSDGQVWPSAPNGVLTQWWRNAPSRAKAAAVRVSGGQLVAGISAAMAAGGSITGRVTDEGGRGLAGVDVDVSGTSAATAVTAADGTFRASGLATGRYTVYFAVPSGLPNEPPTGFIGQYYQDAALSAQATKVTVTAGTPTSGVLATLHAAAVIRGRVTGSDGSPLGDVQVATTDGDGYTVTAADGTYSLRVHGGSYGVCFSSWDESVVGECYDDVATGGDPTPVPVAAGLVRDGIDAQLTVPAGIRGTVTTDGGEPLSDLLVSVSGAAGDFSAWTDGVGNYEVPGLTPGTYTVCFWPGSDAYVAECFDDRTGDDPTPVELGSSWVRVDAQIGLAVVAGAAIGGSVTDDAGAPLAGIYVTGDADGATAGTYTGTDGSYVLQPAPTGDVLVCFWSFDGRFVNECFDNADPLTPPTLVHIEPDQVIGGIDAVLTESQ